MMDFKKKSWIYSSKNGSNHLTYFFLLWKRWQWEQQKELHFFVWSLSHCLQVCTSWWKYLYVWVYPPILPQPLAKMDGCHSRRWGSICLWNPPESILWIYRGGSKPEQEDDETLGQLCSDRVCMNTDWSCTISSRLFSSVLVVFLCFSPRNPSTDKFKWPPLTPENKEYITLNTSPPEIKTHFRAEKCHFWNNIFPQIMNVTGKMSFMHLNSNVACITQSWQKIYILKFIFHAVCPQLPCRRVLHKLTVGVRPAILGAKNLVPLPSHDWWVHGIAPWFCPFTAAQLLSLFLILSGTQWFRELINLM